jgi:hypothetical protein
MTTPQFRELRPYADSLRPDVRVARRFRVHLATVPTQRPLAAEHASQRIAAVHAALRTAFDAAFPRLLAPLLAVATAAQVYDTDRLTPSPTCNVDTTDSALRDIQWEREHWRRAVAVDRADREAWLSRYFARSGRSVNLQLQAAGLGTDVDFWWWLISRAHPVLTVPAEAIDWSVWLANTIEPSFVENPAASISKSAFAFARQASEDGVSLALVFDRLAESIEAHLVASSERAVALFDLAVAEATFGPKAVARYIGTGRTW